MAALSVVESAEDEVVDSPCGSVILTHDNQLAEINSDFHNVRGRGRGSVAVSSNSLPYFFNNQMTIIILTVAVLHIT